MAGDGLVHRDVRVEGLRFHCVEAGSGPLVLLLHGFPEFWFAWRRVIPALAAAGYRVVAPDLRGYAGSDRPAGVESYRVEALVRDVAGLVRALGGEQSVVVGHDWGGVVAWYVGMTHPELLRGLAVLNAPHPAAYRREVRRFSSQVLRSWYAGAFQLPHLPEAVLLAGDAALLRRILRAGPAPDPADLAEYREAFRDPGALAAAIHYYRAALRFPPPPTRAIHTPTLLLWGDRDPWLVRSLAEGLEDRVHPLRVEHLPDAGHWLHLTHAPTVSARLLRFLRELPAA